MDGLRAVAVYLVVLFHAGVRGFAGGFVGVDVFFVLSGFLVTRLLLRDFSVGGGGRLEFGRFYARRFRRLLPAAFVVLVVTGLVFAALASPVEVTDTVESFQAAFLYVTNWYFVAQSADYFGADISTNPVLHFWSLAVEEQFYLVWPILLAGLFGMTRRAGIHQRQVVRGSILVVAVASFVWAWALKTSDPARAYYGTDARAYQLMAGAFLAFTPGLFTRITRHARLAQLAAPIALAALIVIATDWVRLNPIERGAAATAITVALLLALETTGAGVTRQALSVAPVVYLGRISYSTYLWHWPVILVIDDSFEISPISTFALAVLVATGLASLSYQVLEHPIRISTFLDRHRSSVITAGLAVSAFSAFVIIPTVVSPTTSANATLTDIQPVTTGFTPVPDLDYGAITDEVPVLMNCDQKPSDACTLVAGTGQTILLIGDSHAAMMIPALTAIARQHDLTLSVSVRVLCPWPRGLFVTDAYNSRAICEQHQEDLYDRVIPEIDPELIVAMNRPYESLSGPASYLGPNLELLERGTAEGNAWLESHTLDALDELRAGGRTVVLLEPIPFQATEFDTLACLSQASVVEECRTVAESASPFLEDLYRRIDRDDDHVWSVDLDRQVCPFLPVCDPIIDGEVVSYDGTHLTRRFSTKLAPALEEHLVSNGILP